MTDDVRPAAYPEWILFDKPFRELNATAGMLIELSGGDRYLVGDINELGGVCDDCQTVGSCDVVHRYAWIWRAEPNRQQRTPNIVKDNRVIGAQNGIYVEEPD